MRGLRAAVAWAALPVLTGCARPAAVPLDEIDRQGHAALEQGDLDAASVRADEGRRRAEEQGDGVRAFTFTVLQAEVVMKRRYAEQALDLLRAPAPPGTPIAVRVRALMTEGFARCYRAAAAGPAAAADGPRADALLGEAEALAASLGSTRAGAQLSAETALRRGACLVLRDDGARADPLLRQVFATAGALRMRHLEAHAAGSLGWLRLRNGRYDDAADWLERSLALSAGLHADTLDAKLLTNLGWCYTMLGDADKALPLLEQAAETARRRGYTEELEIALAHMGTVRLQLGDPAAARTHYQEALEIARRLHRLEDAQELLSLLQAAALRSGDGPGAQAYAHQAAALLAQARSADPPPSLTEAFLELERRDLARAERLYTALTAAADADTRWRAHAGLARVFTAAGRVPDAAAAYRRAHAAIEQMRTELKQDTFDFLLHSSLTEFYGRHAAFLVDQGQAAEALAVVDRHRGRVLWERVGPAERASPPPRRFEGTARACGAALLAYWIGERSFAWTVTAGQTVVRELPPAAEIQARVQRYQSVLLRSRDPHTAAPDEGSALYRMLVGPLRVPRGSRVIVVPDGPLHQLSFDTLIVPGPRPRFWAEDVVTLRAPSLALLSTRVPRARADRRLLLVGDPVQPSEAFPSLPHAGREIVSVRRHFPPGGAVVLAGQDATAAAFKAAQPGRFGFIHFAAHTATNRARPLESAVVLTRNQAGYKLYARDLLDLPIRAEMVTLSACQGAGSRAYGGEGLVGLAWAFLRAGARHVVAGLWNVEDASTARLMDRLYLNVSRGLAPPEALQAARLDMIRSTDAYRKPFYWAPFVVYAQDLMPPSGHSRATARLSIPDSH